MNYVRDAGPLNGAATVREGTVESRSNAMMNRHAARLLTREALFAPGHQPAQTALRDIIGRTSLTELLCGRARIEEELQKLIDERSNPWGTTVQSVEMRDVVIPDALRDAISALRLAGCMTSTLRRLWPDPSVLS
jgi:hypothetical protein